MMGYDDINPQPCEIERLEAARKRAVAMKRPSAALAVAFGRMQIAGAAVDVTRAPYLDGADRYALGDALTLLHLLGVVPRLPFGYGSAQ